MTTLTLLPASENAVAVDAFAITATGLTVNRQATWDEWTNFMLMLAKEYSKLKWLISDALVYGNDAFGDDIYQLVDDMWSEQTVANYTSTARRIPANERRADVSFSNHSEVASLTTEDRKHALDMVASGAWNRADVREYKRNLKGLPQAVDITITLQYQGHSIKNGILTVAFVEPVEAYEIVGYKAIVRKRQAVSVDARNEAA